MLNLVSYQHVVCCVLQLSGIWISAVDGIFFDIVYLVILSGDQLLKEELLMHEDQDCSLYIR